MAERLANVSHLLLKPRRTGRLDHVIEDSVICAVIMSDEEVEEESHDGADHHFSRVDHHVGRIEKAFDRF